MNFDEANRAIKEYIEQADSEDLPRYKLNPHYKDKTAFYGIVLKSVLAVLVVICIIMVVNLLYPISNETSEVPDGIVNEECQVNMYVEVNGEKMVDGGTYNVCPGDIITVEASSGEAIVERIGYCFGYGSDEEIIDVYNNHIEIIVPEMAYGYTERLCIEVIASNDNGSPNTVTKSGWKKYYLNYVEESSECQINMYAEVNGEKMVNKGQYKVSSGDIITIEASSEEATIAFISHYISPDSNFDNRIKVKGNRAEIVVPEAEGGSVKYLYVEPVANNDDGSPNTVSKTGWQKYILEYINDIYLKNHDTIIPLKTITEVNFDDSLQIYSDFPSNQIANIQYRWETEENSVKITDPQKLIVVSVPEYFEPDRTYKLYINATFTNGLCLDDRVPSESRARTYYITFKQNKNLKILANGFEIENGSTTKVRAGTELNIYAYPSDEVVKIFYKLGSSEIKYIDGSFKKIKIPEDAKVGDKYKMLVTVLYSDELYLDNRTAYETVWEVFEFEIIE